MRVENDSLAEDADRAVKVRVHVPKGGSYNVYTYRDGRWDSVSYTRDGSYIVFEQPNRDITFAVARSKHGPLLYILLGLALCALLVCVIRAAAQAQAPQDGRETEAAVVDAVEPVDSETDRFEGAVEDEAETEKWILWWRRPLKRSRRRSLQRRKAPKLLRMSSPQRRRPPAGSRKTSPRRKHRPKLRKTTVGGTC